MNTHDSRVDDALAALPVRKGRADVDTRAVEARLALERGGVCAPPAELAREGSAPESFTDMPVDPPQPREAQSLGMGAYNLHVERLDSDPSYRAEYAELISREIQTREARTEAVRALSGDAGRSAFDAGTLADMLDRPAPPPDRITGLVPSDAGTLVVAQRKTGKTTFTLNLARALLTGVPFLDRFEVEPVVGAVGFLNFEVSGHQLSRWAAEVRMPAIPADRFYQVNLRGRRNPLSHPEDAALLAKALRSHEVETLIVDPFGRAFDGESQNDAGAVGRWLVDLDAFAREQAQVRDVILTAHAGWDGSRSRGSTALEDWADSIVTLTLDADGRRYLRAMGRDVEVAEDQLHYDEPTRTLRLTGQGSAKTARSRAQNAELVDRVVAAVGAKPGSSVQETIDTLRSTTDATFQDVAVRQALKVAEQLGLIVRKELGPGRRTEHFPIAESPTPSNPVQTPSADAPPPPSNPVYVDGVGVDGVDDQNLGRGSAALTNPQEPGANPNSKGGPRGADHGDVVGGSR